MIVNDMGNENYDEQYTRRGFRSSMSLLGSRHTVMGLELMLFYPLTYNANLIGEVDGIPVPPLESNRSMNSRYMFSVKMDLQDCVDLDEGDHEDCGSCRHDYTTDEPNEYMIEVYGMAKEELIEARKRSCPA